jgi:DNA-binding transcriptional ArsR family regulator
VVLSSPDIGGIMQPARFEMWDTVRDTRKKNLEDIMELLDVLKALSNETRLQIIQWLKQPDVHFPKPLHGDIHEDGVCVSDIQKKVGLSQSTVSLYLSMLQKAGLIKAKRIGQFTYYKRDEENIKKVMERLSRDL